MKMYGLDSLSDLRQMRIDPEEHLRNIETDGIRKYRNDPLFHSQVVIGANIITHKHPDIDPGEARHTALLVIAASQQEVQ